MFIYPNVTQKLTRDIKLFIKCLKITDKVKPDLHIASYGQTAFGKDSVCLPRSGTCLPQFMLTGKSPQVCTNSLHRPERIKFQVLKMTNVQVKCCISLNWNKTSKLQ